MAIPIRGIVPPLVTPLAARNLLDTAGLERLIERCIAAGVHGLFILGTTGEGPSLSQSLRREMISTSARLIGGRVPLYVGITDTSLVDAIALAEVAAQHGAAAAVAAPPFYFPAGQTELRHWFTQLAEAIPLPLLLYNMPSCTRISIEYDSLAELIELENVAGLKDSSGDLDYLAAAVQLAAAKRPHWPVMVGPEALLQKAMSLGAVGGVTGGANLCPELFTDMYSAVQSADQQRISVLQDTIDQLQILYTFGKYGSSYLKGLKCALELTDICSGQLAAPFDVFREPERQQVRKWLTNFSELGYLAPLTVK